MFEQNCIPKAGGCKGFMLPTDRGYVYIPISDYMPKARMIPHLKDFGLNQQERIEFMELFK